MWLTVEMAATRAPVLLSAFRLDGTDASGWIPPPRNPIRPKPLLSLSKPSWIVSTESNVWKEQKKKPDPPCDGCSGSGRVECRDCCGKGRTNYVHLAMLPKGEWPKWCRTCGGSGLGYCSRCFGAGDNRFVLALPFMKRASNDIRDPKKYEVGDKSGPQTAADFLRNGQ